jgi:hypothetical protein
VSRAVPIAAAVVVGCNLLVAGFALYIAIAQAVTP